MPRWSRLWIDRPQRTSSHPAALYGFIRKTYCGGSNKIIAVLEGDHVWRDATDFEDLPHILVERLQHDTFELEIGNILVYAVPLWESGDRWTWLRTEGCPTTEKRCGLAVWLRPRVTA
jgi:hypothetical protein